ncbi:neprilysin-4-like isoform X2 [Phymastichus coffea]|uniref:neprilysin-4-like isoform X2 n=1 Tax=Phymastichus coffea TaxID=108790 RepID=UPI00273B16EE|nr:neprilysin-4-like isoform X2 [Phymastichus coffea]
MRLSRQQQQQQQQQQQHQQQHQISDDEDEEDTCPAAAAGICPSCRLAVNKDTGRHKWCMGGNDIWRTRIRFMLLIPAVILPLTIIVIALSKSTVVGKLSMRNSQPQQQQQQQQQQQPAPPPSADDERAAGFIPGARSDYVKHAELSVRALQPDLRTSFLPAESLDALCSLQRRKRDSQRQRAAPASIDAGATTTTTSAAATRTSKGQAATSPRRHSTAVGADLKSEQPLRELTRPARSSASSEEDTEEEDCIEEDGDLEEDEIADEREEDSEDSEDEDEDAQVEQQEEKRGVAVHWRTRSTVENFDVDKSHSREDDDDSAPYSVEDHESMDYRAFWRSNWDEDFIRKAQAKMMLKYMDRTVAACDDFYQYSCGNWDKYNSIPEDKTGYDVFETLRESLDLVLKQLLEEPVSSADAYDASAVRKAKNLFDSCMNSGILERRLERPLLELLDDLGGWPIIRPEWDYRRFDWLLLVARLRLYSNDILISEWIGPDIKNSEQYIIQDYYLEASNTVYLMAYKNYLVTIASLLGASLKSASLHAEELVRFEIQLANITLSPSERRNSSELYRRMRLDELHALIPEIDWHRYLSLVLDRPVGLSEPVMVFATEYLQNLVKLLSRTPPRIVANYLLWRFVRHRVNNLDDRFQEAKQTFYYILLGREKAPSRWKNCVAQVNWNMGVAVGSIFVRKYFDETSKNDTLFMTREIQNAFHELLNQSPWLDTTTKRLASEKVKAMQLRIGYPDFILHPSELDRQFHDVHIHPDKYFENILNMLRHTTRVEHDRLGTPVNKTLWNTGPAIVNAYYNRNRNQITFPAGILQPPFYHRYFPRSLNYGGIGVVIGHEITHGFDNKGRMFDKFGNFHRWWSEATINEFEQRASCFIDQYNKYMVKDVALQVDGFNTQGENIADNGGIKQAFRAYEKWLSQNSDAKESLPGIDATGKQLFFLNFAQVWCGSMRPEAMRHKIKTDLHSPGRFRVIGTLSNFEEFSKAFNCPLGSPMNPVNKCLVW